jgi:hypothetical protein
MHLVLSLARLLDVLPIPLSTYLNPLPSPSLTASALHIVLQCNRGFSLVLPTRASISFGHARGHVQDCCIPVSRVLWRGSPNIYFRRFPVTIGNCCITLAPYAQKPGPGPRQILYSPRLIPYNRESVRECVCGCEREREREREREGDRYRENTHTHTHTHTHIPAFLCYCG